MSHIGNERFLSLLGDLKKDGLLERCATITCGEVSVSLVPQTGPSADERVTELERRLEEERKIRRADEQKERDEDEMYGSS